MNLLKIAKPILFNTEMVKAIIEGGSRWGSRYSWKKDKSELMRLYVAEG